MNIGIIGAGFFGQKHAEALAVLEDMNLVAASRTDVRALEQFVQHYGGRGYLDYRDLIADPQVDAVVIATPHFLHTDIAVAAAQAGKHILLEKPMAPTLEECDQIISAANSAEVKLMVGHTNQFLPTYRLAKKLISAGEVGDVVLGVSTMVKVWLEENRRPWHFEREQGGGMWLTAGIHCLDRLTWLVGSRAIRVSAQFGTFFHDQQADDTGLVFLRYANGCSGTVVSVGYQSGGPKHLTELICTKATLSISFDQLQIGRGDRWQTVPESVTHNPADDALANEWRAFRDAIQLDLQPSVSGEYARHIMATAFAAEHSSTVRQEVDVP